LQSLSKAAFSFPVLRADHREYQARVMIEIKHSLIPIIVTLLLATATPGKAKNIDHNQLENTLAHVRDKLINRGILAYQSGYYSEALHLLRNFLNPHRIITAPLEKEGLNYLALAYQSMGESTQATATITRAISITNNSLIELANLENTAGIIANQQNKQIIAIKHWEKARQLYLANNFLEKWTETTLNLAQNYRKLGDEQKYQQLLQELAVTTHKHNQVNNAISQQ